jgi:hypothetical protein
MYTTTIGFDEESQKYHELKVSYLFNLVHCRDIDNH